MRELTPADGIWRGDVCPECKGINPLWYDERYHGLPECGARHHDGHFEGCKYLRRIDRRSSAAAAK